MYNSSDAMTMAMTMTMTITITITITINTNTNIECMMKVLIFTCSDGIKLGGKQWSHVNDHIENSNNSLIICLHGWLDNASSFDSLAP